MDGGAGEGKERQVMERPPGPLADVPPDVEAADDDRHQVEPDLAGRDPDRGVRRFTRDRDLGECERDGLVKPQQHAVDRRQTESDTGQVLMEGKGDRAMRDRIEKLRREQEPVDDRGGQRGVREEGEQALEDPWKDGAVRVPRGQQRVERSRAGRPDDDPHRDRNETPAEPAGARIEALEPHASQRVVAAWMTSSSRSVNRSAASTPARSRNA